MFRAVVAVWMVWAVGLVWMVGVVQPVMAVPVEEGEPGGLRVAVTIDDLPFIGGLKPGDTYEAAIGRVLAAARGAEAPLAVFFTCYRWESLTPEGAYNDARVRQWLAAGVEVGNHSHSHKSLDKLGFDAWLADIKGCQAKLEEINGAKVPFFRYPFLQTGATAALRDQGLGALQGLGLRRAPVTIDTSDWALNDPYVEALRRGDQATADEIAAAYVAHVRAAARHYVGVAASQGRQGAPHILLLHANALAADHLPKVLATLRAEGFGWATLQEALAHPLYAAPDLYVGPIGLSWLYRVDAARSASDAWRWDNGQTEALTARFAASPEPEDHRIDKNLRVRALGDGAWVVVHEQPWAANALLVEMRDDAKTLILVDTPYTDAATQSLLDWIGARFGARPLIAINTHFHPDALGGNKALIRAGARVIGADATERLTTERREAMGAQLASWLTDRPEQAALFSPYAPTPPAEVFPVDEGLTLRFGGERVEVIYPGPAHSPDGVVVYWPSRRLLFGGCMVMAGEKVGNTSDADIAAWPRAIERLQRLDAAVIIPGHGDRADPDLLTHTLRLLADAPK
jgi:metallo-beta-lactamase class B